MAKILYGVQGVTHGHAMRALTLARRFGEHDFLFVTSEDAAEILGREFEVHPSLNLTTIYRDYKTDAAATMKAGAGVLRRRKGQIKDLLAVIDRFQPDAAVYDYEYFTPRAARIAGVPCLSLDHQHILTLCRHDLPPRFWHELMLQGASVRLFFSQASDYLVISFYQPPVKSGLRAVVAPPLLRNSVLEHQPTVGEHILVYQSCSLYEGFAPLLKQVDREFVVYGYNQDRVDGNLTFKSFSEHGFLRDLAASRYVICGGSHTLISECLHYRKPVLSLPIGTAIEQRLNAMYLERLGYGRQRDMFKLTPADILAFEAEVEACRSRIAQRDFHGNERVYELFSGFVREGRLPI
jgi:uncharacterized protein (TIGR00661 family)